MDAPAGRILAVGHGRFDALSGELCIDGRKSILRPRTAALLAHLVRHADRVVTKDELMRTVWPDAVVTEDSLVQCVKEIRHALADSGRDWIRTVPRQGYAFVAAAAQPGAPTEMARRVVRWRVPLLLLLVVAGASVAWRLWPVGGWQTPSLVVLPIVNLTGDSAHELTADDLTEGLAMALARQPDTIVIAPGTAFTFKGKAVDARDVGRALDVRYVLEGSLRGRTDQWLLDLRLVDAASARQLWNDEFVADGGAAALHEEVRAHVAQSLSLRLANVEARRAQGVPPHDPVAVEMLARARALLRWSGGDGAVVQQARGLVEDALRLDDTQAQAWTLLAKTHLVNVRFSPTREQSLKAADDAAARALALAPDSAEARVMRAWVLYETRRMPEALAEFDRALELAPNGAPILAGRGAALIMLGRPDEAIAPVDKAMRISPRDPLLADWQMFRGVAELHRGRPDAAADWLTQAVNGGPGSPFPRLFLASALGAAGRTEAAHEQLAQFRRLRPGFTLRDFQAREPSDGAAFRLQRERVYDGLRVAGMTE